MTSISGMRGPMLKEPRRSAKAILTRFLNSSLVKFERGESMPDAIKAQVIIQLRVYRDIAKEMRWTQLEKRIEAALRVGTSETPS